MPEENNNTDVTVIFKAEPQIVAALDKRARANDRTRSGELRAILRATLGLNADIQTEV